MGGGTYGSLAGSIIGGAIGAPFGLAPVGAAIGGAVGGTTGSVIEGQPPERVALSGGLGGVGGYGLGSGAEALSAALADKAATTGTKVAIEEGTKAALEQEAEQGAQQGAQQGLLVQQDPAVLDMINREAANAYLNPASAYFWSPADAYLQGSIGLLPSSSPLPSGLGPTGPVDQISRFTSSFDPTAAASASANTAASPGDTFDWLPDFSKWTPADKAMGAMALGSGASAIGGALRGQQTPRASPLPQVGGSPYRGPTADSALQSWQAFMARRHQQPLGRFVG